MKRIAVLDDYQVSVRTMPGWDAVAGLAYLDALVDGRACGLVVEWDGSEVRVRASPGIVLAGGGFPASPELRELYFPKPVAQYTSAFEGCVGETLLEVRSRDDQTSCARVEAVHQQRLPPRGGRGGGPRAQDWRRCRGIGRDDSGLHGRGVPGRRGTTGTRHDFRVSRGEARCGSRASDELCRRRSSSYPRSVMQGGMNTDAIILGGERRRSTASSGKGDRAVH